MDKEIIDLSSDVINNMIYEIRGLRVMFDFDLARIYGYETKRFNEQVKNNIEKFPERFRFQLNKSEIDYLVRSKKSTSALWASGGGGRGYLPYVFTEQGIYMLMTVLKGDLATKQSIALIDAFKQMKDFIIENNSLLVNTNSYLESKFATYDKRFEVVEDKIDSIMENFTVESTYKHILILNGQRIEADIAYQNIYNLAEKSIYIIDDYIDIKTLQLLKLCKAEINIVIITDNKAKNRINNVFIDDFKKDTGLKIMFKQNNRLFHDRYIVIDFYSSNETIYHCGGSSKDAGKRISTINKIEDAVIYKNVIRVVLNHNELNIKLLK